MVSGNDAANMLADMLGGQRVAVAAMNRKAASVGARSTRASSPSGLDGPGWEIDHHPARSRGDLPRRAELSVDRPDPAAAVGRVPRQGASPSQNELLTRYPGDLGGKTGYTDLARKTYVGAAQRGRRRLVVVQMYGTGDLYGQAIGLFDWGFGQAG